VHIGICKSRVSENKQTAKFYTIHVSLSEKELQAMGNTEQEQAEAILTVPVQIIN
jgi:hypothetical protein